MVFLSWFKFGALFACHVLIARSLCAGVLPRHVSAAGCASVSPGDHRPGAARSVQAAGREGRER